MPHRLATALLALALAVPRAGRAEDAGLVEPMFVDGVLPPAANGLTLAVGAGRSTYTLATVQLDVALGERAGASVSLGLFVAPGERERIALSAPVARFKLALLTPAEGRPALVLGLNLFPSSRGLSQSEAGLTLGLAWRSGPATLELVGGAETRAALSATEALMGASVGLEVAPRWRVIAEALGELGEERDVSAGAVVGFQVDARTLLLAGCLAGVTRDAEPYAVVLQVKRDL